MIEGSQGVMTGSNGAAQCERARGRSLNRKTGCHNEERGTDGFRLRNMPWARGFVTVWHDLSRVVTIE
jgi:hypothetical protein